MNKYLSIVDIRSFVLLFLLILVNHIDAQSITSLCSAMSVTSSAIDSKGNLYTTDRSAKKVFKITPTGNVTTLVSTGLIKPWGIAIDKSDNVFVSDIGAFTINQIDSAGNMSVFVSLVNGPRNMVFDIEGNLYVAQFIDGSITKITPNGYMSGFAATGAAGLTGICFGPSGNLYATNANTGVVYKITPQGTLTSFQSIVANPADITVDEVGNTYLADSKSTRIVKYNNHSQNPATFNLQSIPQSLNINKSGSLYIGSFVSADILKVDFNAAVAVTSTYTGPICSNNLIAFKAHPVNGGPTPSFQWKINGNNFGSITSDSTLLLPKSNNKDSISCFLISSSPFLKANAVSVLDNTQNAIPSTNANTNYDISFQKRNARVFRSATSNRYALDSIKLMLKCYNPASSNKVVVSLAKVDSLTGMPTGIILQSDTLYTALTTTYNYVNLPLSGWSLMPGMKYAIVIGSVDSTLSLGTLNNNPPYTSQEGFVFVAAEKSIDNGSTWTDVSAVYPAMKLYATKVIDSFASNGISLTVKPTISGSVIYPGTKALITNVTTTIRGSFLNYLTSSSGYEFNCLPIGGNYIVKPFKFNDINKTNGVTTLDIALIQSHILGKTKFNSPYKLIAADVNGDGKVTTLDIVYLKRLILGLDTTFAKASSNEKRLWVFVDSSYKFADTTSPFPYKDSITISSLNANKTNQTFYGIKLGDVNWDWNPSVARMVNTEIIDPTNREEEEVKQSTKDAINKD